jgi:hypothetical protein
MPAMVLRIEDARHRQGLCRWLGVLGLLGVLSGAALLFSAPPALGTVAWSVRSIADPTLFSPNDAERCRESLCDRYVIVVRNVGGTTSTGPITVIDKLPPGITTTGIEGGEGVQPEGLGWTCSAPAAPAEMVNTVECATSSAVKVASEKYARVLSIPVRAPSLASGLLKNEVSVTGGGAESVGSAGNETTIGSGSSTFGLTDFSFNAINLGGGEDVQAGSHPYDVTASFDLSDIFHPPEVLSTAEPIQPVENPKDAIVELPAGFLGNPQARAKCKESDLVKGSEGSEGERSGCPAESRVGEAEIDIGGSVRTTSERNGPTAIYNMVPQPGYPAEFAFAYASVGKVYMYANVVHTSAGDRLRIAVPGIPTALHGVVGASLTFFGDPAALEEPQGAHVAFLTNPTDCSAAPLSAKIQMDSWENPGRWVSAESRTYPQVTGCDLLQFSPSLELAPSSSPEGGTSQADEPSAYSVDLKVPQTSLFEERATPELKDATVTLPEGVSVSPSAADGLVGCAEEGPAGINIGKGNLSPEGQDLSDPEATKLGAGHAGGNGSPYDDGLYHTAPGHCPAASTIGTVEVVTPLLASPLKGHIYLAQPKCGGSTRPACTEASATNGELYGIYLEAAGSGVIVKLRGKVAANPSTGRLTSTFSENPQLPFSELKLHFSSGPRAPLANPQSCGSFTTTSSLTSWASETPTTPSSTSFNIDGDGKGGACPASPPFAPGFSAGTTSPIAGEFSPFVLSFSRQDREQDLAGLSVTLPPGLLGKIAGIPLCGEAPADAGTCGPESQIGTASVLAGPGEHPLYVSGGRVYLTTGYKGGSFGLSIVVPAVAGPFDLGNVIVRAAIHIDPKMSQVTVASDQLPQSRDGVPFRLQTVNVEINRSGFTFNPTNCAQQQVTGTITGAQGATASVASPFAVAGCTGLPFKPSFTASTSGKTSKADGASLVVKVSQKPGEANIHKVDLQLPLALPARLTTLQKACTEAQFNANPAGCPAASNIGTATAVTPVLGVPLTGPAYLVSHGGAAFPDVEFVLQGEGVTIVLDGGTDIKKGITYSRFETVPDAPIGSFETILPEGPHSALAANTNLCTPTKTVTVKKRVTVRRHGRTVHVLRSVKEKVAEALAMPTTITGQNGAVLSQTTKISVTGCPKTKKNAKQKARGTAKQHKVKGRKK